MWDSEKVLRHASEKTGKSVAELKRTPWSEIEEMLNVRGVDLSRRRYGFQPEKGARVVTRAQWDKEKAELLGFLEKQARR